MTLPVLRTCVLDFWTKFEPEHLERWLPELGAFARIEIVHEPSDADLIVFSCFPGGRRSERARDPHAWSGSRGVRLFYTAENVRPDFAICDFALTFCRDLVDARHVRLPNYTRLVPFQGWEPSELSEPPRDPEALLASKRRFCTYVQGNPVPEREAFVRRLSQYRRVDCAGPSLNNTGFIADRARKYELYRESKFAITFENERAVGYTSEKLPDALVFGSVPIYRGDPTVTRDFDARCFVDVSRFASVDEAVEHIAELDRDDAAYLEVLGAPRATPEFRGRPAELANLLERAVNLALARASERAGLATPGGSAGSGRPTNVLGKAA